MINLGEKNLHEGLFQIGDVAKCCGVDRQTILFYEKKGLFNPTVQNKNSGYRYYSAEAVTDLMRILQLRDIGLSLCEINDYFKNGTSAAERVVVNLEKKLDALLTALEYTRALSIKKYDYSIVWTKLPAMRCFVQEYICRSVDEAINSMYDAFHRALSLKMNVRSSYHIFAEYPDETGDAINLTNFLMRICIPVSTTTSHPNCKDIHAMSGISVCHRGDYAELGGAYHDLWKYAEAHSLTPIAPVREYYLNNRMEHKNDADRYVTRLILPVKEQRII